MTDGHGVVKVDVRQEPDVLVYGGHKMVDDNAEDCQRGQKVKI